MWPCVTVFPLRLLHGGLQKISINGKGSGFSAATRWCGGG